MALGAPLGKAAWGGQHEGVLPTRLRVASGVAAVVVYPLIIVLVLASVGRIAGEWLPWTGTAVTWVLAGVFTVGGMANLASRSKIERYWAPISLVIAGCCGIVATQISFQRVPRLSGRR